MGRVVPFRLISDSTGDSSNERDDELSFGVLGPLVVAGPCGPVSIPLGRERAVLAQLIARVGRPVGVDVLVDGLWPDVAPASAERTLHAHMARLRGRLEPGRAGRQHSVIVTTGRGYMLATAAERVDASRFEALVDRAVRDVANGAELRVALGLWRGAAFEGFDDIAMCAQEGRRLDGLRLAALELRLDADLATRADATLVADLEMLVAEHPFRERFWEQLMLCLYRVGRQTDALAAYKHARQILIEEMGVEPGPGLRHLEAAILDHDVGLLSTPPGPPRRVMPLALESVGPSLVGREDELAALLEWWSSCQAGHGGFISLLGPEGVGKTRLAAELAARVQDRDGIVLFARCDHALVGPRPLLDAALRSQGSSIDSVSLGADSLAVAIAQHLAAWHDGRSVLIVLDDLHLADPETLSAVAEMAEWCTSMPVLIVGTFHADDLEATATGRHVALGALDRQAVATICQLYRSDGWSTDDVSRVLELSGGLPLQVHRGAAAVAEHAVVEQLGSDVERMNAARVAASSSRAAATDAVLGLRRLVERRHRYARRVAVGERDVNPYFGLARYEESDAEVFFGRDRLVAELTVRLASNDLVAIVGPSGSGKSSLVRAGVLGALARGGLPGSERWPRVVITPGTEPRAALATIAASATAGGRVLVIDQFEELYTLGHDSSVQRQFLDELDRLADGRGTRVVVVVRSDQLGHLAEHPRIANRLTDATMLIGSMSAAEIRQVVEGPAARVGLAVEPALVDQVVADAADGVGALPLVSTALAATWERRTEQGLTAAGYTTAGRVSGAIARLAEEAWDSMPDATAVAAKRILLRLVRPGEGGVAETRLRARPADLVPAGDAAASDAIARLVQRRLLIVDTGTVEITHEALLREWPRLAGWLAEDVESRRLHHHLAAAAALWSDGGDDDGDLLRGARLAAATEWCSAGHAADLNDVEVRFVTASVAVSDRQLAAARHDARRQTRANRRLRGLLAGIAGLLIAAIVGGIIAMREADRADTEAASARHQAERADAAALSADAERLGALAGLETDLDVSLLLAAQAYSMADTASTRGALLRGVQQSPLAVGLIRSDAARPLALELSPDGATLAVNENLGGTTLYDAATGRRIGHWGTMNALQALAWTPDGTAFATLDAGTGHDDSDPARWAIDIVVVDAATMTERARYTGRTDWLSDLAFSPDGRVLVAAPNDPGGGRLPQVTVWDVARPGEPTAMIELPDSPRSDDGAVSFDATGRLVAVSVIDATVLIDVRTGQQTGSFEGSGGMFSPDGRTIALNNGAAVRPLSLDLVDVDTGIRRTLQGGHTEGIIHRDFSRDGTLLATVSDDRLVRVWDTATGEELHTLAGHTGRVLASAFSPDGLTLYSTGLDRAIVTWDLAGRETVKREIVPTSDDPGFGSDYFVVTSDESTAVALEFGTDLLSVVDLATGAVAEPIDTDHGTVNSLLPSGGATVITSGDDGAIRRWDAVTGALLAENEPADPDLWLYPLTMTPDHSTVYAQVGPNTIRPFDAVTLEARDGNEVDVGHWILEGALSPDSRFLAVSTRDPAAVGVVDLQTGDQKFLNVPGHVHTLAFAPDGSLLAAGDDDGRVLRIDPADATLVGEPVIGHDGPVLHVAFSPDGSLITSDGTDGIVGIWETATGRSTGVLQPGPPNEWVRSTWAMDGYTLLIMHEDRSVDAFDTRPGSWLDYACRTAARQLTPREWAELLPDRPYDPTCD